jgi:hypothetical protein
MHRSDQKRPTGNKSGSTCFVELTHYDRATFTRSSCGIRNVFFKIVLFITFRLFCGHDRTSPTDKTAISANGFYWRTVPTS